MGSSSSDDDSTVDTTSEVKPPEPVPGTSTDLDPVVDGINGDIEKEQDSRSVDQLSSGSDATLPYCDNSDSNSNVSSRDCSRDSSPYPSCSDLSLHYSSRIDRSSDLSQESSPCPSPGDFGNGRRSAKVDRYSDTSRDASPLIFDSDFGLRRSSRNRARLKNIPPLHAARDLSNFLLDENSASNSSLAGENSLSGLGSSLFKDTVSSRRSSKSSEVTEDSNDCDIQVSKLFTNSKTSNSAVINKGFHKVLLNTESELNENFEHDLHKSEPFGKLAAETSISESKKNAMSESDSSVSKSNVGIRNSSSVESLSDLDTNETAKDATNAAEGSSNLTTEEDMDFNGNAIISDPSGANEDINMADEIDQSENENNTNLEIELSSQSVASNQGRVNSDNKLTGNSDDVVNQISEPLDVKVKLESDISASSLDNDFRASKCEIKTENIKQELMEERSDLQAELRQFESVKSECKNELSIEDETDETEDDNNIKDRKDLINQTTDTKMETDDCNINASVTKSDLKREDDCSDVKSRSEGTENKKDADDIGEGSKEIKQEESEDEEDEIVSE